MNNLQDIINLAKIDGGKFFVIDETGEAKLVILPMEEYQRLLLGKLQKQILDVENVNKLITKIQLEEDITPQNLKGSPRSDQQIWSGIGAQLQEVIPSVPNPSQVMPQPTVKGPTLSHTPAFTRVDLRAEVIDPSFDFEAPKVEIDDL